jgi:hypothetical protein
MPFIGEKCWNIYAILNEAVCVLFVWVGRFKIKPKKYVTRLKRSIGFIVVDTKLLRCGNFLFVVLTLDMDFCKNKVDFPWLSSADCLCYSTYDILGMEITWIFMQRLVFKGGVKKEDGMRSYENLSTTHLPQLMSLKVYIRPTEKY